MEELKTVIVDPDRRTREFVESALSARGMRCRGFGTGADALEGCAKERPDLLLVEADLPDTSGFSLVRRLREHAPHAEVCLLSTNTSYDNAVQGLRLGVTDYLLKPLTESQLDAALARSRATAELRRSRAGATPGDATGARAAAGNVGRPDPATTASAVVRVLQGQEVGAVASEIGADVAELDAWRRAFAAASRIGEGDSPAEIESHDMYSIGRRLDGLTRELRDTNALIRKLLESKQT